MSARGRVRRLDEVSTAVHRTEPWQFKRVVAVIEHCAAREFVREVFDHHRGAHRVFTADAFLAAYLLTPMLGLPMHQTKVAEVVRDGRTRSAGRWDCPRTSRSAMGGRTDGRSRRRESNPRIQLGKLMFCH